MKEELSVLLCGVSDLLFHAYTPNFHTTLLIIITLYQNFGMKISIKEGNK
jgi:hypothetical protein